LHNFSAGKKEKTADYGVIEGNIEDAKVLQQIEPVEYMFNFGAPSSVILSNAEPDACTQTTICGFIYLLAWAKKVGVKKVVYPSSGSA